MQTLARLNLQPSFLSSPHPPTPQTRAFTPLHPNKFAVLLFPPNPQWRQTSCTLSIQQYHSSQNLELVQRAAVATVRSNHHPRRDYYIYNPTTKQSRKIVLTTSDKYVDVLGLNLAFDPSKSLHYKIVCIRAATKKYSSPSRHKQCCQIELYDSATCTWKVCMESFLVDLRVKFGTGVHWNQVIHWDNYPLSHLYFDIGKNVIGNLPNAKIPWGEGNGGAAVHCQLEESNGYLHHFVIVSDHGDKSIAVFELEEDYSRWILIHHDGFGRTPGKFYILSFVREEGEESSVLVFHVPGKINAYRFADKSFQELVDLTNEPYYQEGEVQFDRDYFQFGENLTPV